MTVVDSPTFADLPALTPHALAAAAALGFQVPTPVQLAAIPVILQGQDLLACAQTGSGKTLAFSLPLLQRLQHQQRALVQRSHSARATPRKLRVLVLVPTRELAVQVGSVFREIARALAHADLDDLPPLKVAVLFGGVSANPQMLALRGGADVAVATPGRLLHLMASNALHLAEVDALVLDEADRLLELGFAQELSDVLARMPNKRQNLFFSATLPPAAQALAGAILVDPARVTIEAGEQTTPAIAQRSIWVDPSKRTQLLRHLIQTEGHTRVLVFTATKFAAHTVAEKLRKARIAAAPFHADLAQGTRSQVLADFKAGRWDVVVTTDLASRGIDVMSLHLVVNYDLPRSADDYTHRIGRTGRAGASGLAISFVSPQTQAHMRLIEKRNGLRVAREQIDGFEPSQTVELVDDALSQTSLSEPPASAVRGLDLAGGIKGKRPSKKDKLRAAANQA